MMILSDIDKKHLLIYTLWPKVSVKLSLPCCQPVNVFQSDVLYNCNRTTLVLLK